MHDTPNISQKFSQAFWWGRYNVFSFSYDFTRPCDQRIKGHFGCGLLMVSHHAATFGNIGSGDIVLLVVAKQNSTCSCLNPPLLFISEAHGIPCSHTRNFAIKRILKKNICQRVRWNKPYRGNTILEKRMMKHSQKTFVSPLMKHRLERGEKSNNNTHNCNTFHVTCKRH